MKKELMVFDNDDFGEVRVFLNGSEGLFSLDDVGFVLGYTKIAKGKMYLRHERINKILEKRDIKPVVHNGQRYLTESNLYDFVLESETENAKKFREWVTADVLPTIRKTGGYVLNNKENDFIDNYFPNLSEELKKSIVKELTENNTKLHKELEESKDKINFADGIEFSKSNVDMKDYADLLNIKNFGRNTMMKWMRRKEFLNKKNVPYRYYVDLGVFETKEKLTAKGNLVMTTYITGKGQVYLYKKLAEDNIIKIKAVESEIIKELSDSNNNVPINTNIVPNKKMNSNNTSGITGVTWNKSNNKWMATIKIGYKLIKLKEGFSKRDCIISRLEAEKKYYGMFAPQSHLFNEYNIS